MHRRLEKAVWNSVYWPDVRVGVLLTSLWLLFTSCCGLVRDKSPPGTSLCASIFFYHVISCDWLKMEESAKRENVFSRRDGHEHVRADLIMCSAG